jgi:hypothetical protein
MNRDLLTYLLIPSVGYWNGSWLTGQRNCLYTKRLLTKKVKHYGGKDYWTGFYAYNYIIDGKRHRDGDKPAVIDCYGSQIWYKNGLIHRDMDRPAILDCFNRTKIWVYMGTYHRDGDEPAVLLLDEHNEIYKAEWFRHGFPYTPENK